MAMMIANNPAGMMPAMSPANGQMSNQMSIGDLLELAIKKTYRELSQLAELLPRKTDMERKIEIMLFANRNRQMFVRLLALVKWAGSASKVEKCSHIVSFLDKQSMLFTETADILARLSRETLVNARFPAFQVLAAVEVLTLGTYSRLPTCIRDRLVPPDPIPNSEKRAALLQLNHIIQQRLVASELPLQMRNIKIEFGRVTFTVPHEFSLSLTLLSDNPNMPWKVLNVEILIEDKEINDLVAPPQLLHIRNFIQLRLNENVKPLMEAYNILHTFCLGLQLQVLYYQARFLQLERLKDFINIDDYVPGKHLVLSYWKNAEKGSNFKLIIKIDSVEPSKPLQIQHIPELNSKVFLKSIQASILSIEKILLFTTHERSKLKLIDLKKLVEEKYPYLICELNELPAVLNISFIQPCMPSEQLLVSVDMLTGKFLAHIPQYLECPIVTELESFLNKDMEKIFGFIERLKTWITRERCKKTVEALPVRTLETLPFPPNYSHESLNIPGNKIFFQFNRHQDKCLMVAFDNDNGNKYSWNTIWMEYYLIHVCHTSVSDSSRPMSAFDQEEPKHFMEIMKVLPLDSSSILQNFNQNNNGGNINEPPPVMSSKIGLKRKFGSEQIQMAKRQKMPGYYITELAHIVSFCEEKLSYNCLSTELYKRNIHHQVVPDLNGYTYYIDIIKFPICPWCPAELTEKIQNNTLCCTIRSHGKSSKLWNVLIAFAHPPIQNLPLKENCLRKIVNDSYDSQSGIVKMVEELLLNWTAIARLYDVVEKFAQDIKSTTLINIGSIEIKSFTYKKISIGYGQSKMFFVSLYYKSSEKRFQLSFGVSNMAFSNTNPHILIATQLQHEFNQHLSIVQLIHVLNYTLNPLLTIQNLKSIPLLGTVNSRPNLPVLSFCVLPEGSNHIKLIYRNTYCLDIVMYADNMVTIRDGALSNFDNSKVINDFIPIQGLKAFLSKFVDKTVQTRRLSQTEDDNPPSPVAQQIEYNDQYMFPGSQLKGSGISMNETNIPSAGRSSAALQHPSPHTPASPMASVLSAHSNYAPSPGIAHSISSPPSHPGLQQQNPIAPSPQMHPLEQSPASTFNINSPMSANLAAPSPSFMPTPSPGPSSNFHTHSPASQFMSQNTPQSHVSDSGIGSPFNQPTIPPSMGPQSLSSPAANLWPGSPSVSRPSPRPVTSSQSPGGVSLINTNQANVPQSQYPHGMQPRSLPQKPWAAALPIMLTHQGFEMMCRPENMNIHLSNIYYSYSQLERFLGATFMRRHFNKPIEENFTIIPTAEPGTIMFKNETLQFKIWMDFNTFQIHLNVKSLSEMNQWSREELDILQQYFETKVAVAPFKPNSSYTFSRFLTVPTLLLKDLIRIMRLELHPDPTLKWTLQINLTIPPFGWNSQGSGMSAFIISQQKKFLLFIQLEKKGPLLPMQTEPYILVLPLIYDISAKSVNIGLQVPNTQNIMNYVNTILKSAEYNSQQNNESCILYPAIRDIMNNLQVP